jgi:hypothetical protein
MLVGALPHSAQRTVERHGQELAGDREGFEAPASASQVDCVECGLAGEASGRLHRGEGERVVERLHGRRHARAGPVLAFTWGRIAASARNRGPPSTLAN